MEIPFLFLKQKFKRMKRKSNELLQLFDFGEGELSDFGN